jgi:chitodextrinase
VAADTTAPSTPTGLAASNAAPTSFVLSWAPASDNAAVSGYEVMRGTVSLGVVASTSITVGGLTAGSTYDMKVRAQDPVGNASGWSATLGVTLPSSGSDGSYVNYAAMTSTTVTLVWGITGSDIFGYNVYRNGSLIGTTTETAFVDVGLTGGTPYTYVVRALDSAGVPAALGVSMSVTTPTASVDSDGDGIPNVVETRFGTDSNAPGTQDANNQMQVILHRPPR